MPAKKWTESLVIEAIQKLHSEKMLLNSRDIRKTHGGLYAAAIRLFHSWSEAVTAAGLAYGEIKVLPKHRLVKRVWTKRNIIRTIRRMHRAGERLNSRYIYQKHTMLMGAAQRRFGSWPQAVEAAGISYKSERRRPQTKVWSREKIIAEIRRRFKKRQRLNVGYIKANDPGFCAVVERYFKGWKQGIRAAGIPYCQVQLCRNRYWNRSRIMTAIYALHRQGNFPLKRNKINKIRGDVVEACRKHFGGWTRAVNATEVAYATVLR